MKTGTEELFGVYIKRGLSPQQMFDEYVNTCWEKFEYHIIAHSSIDFKHVNSLDYDEKLKFIQQHLGHISQEASEQMNRDIEKFKELISQT